VLAVFFVPAFYVAVQGLIELIDGPPKPIGDEGGDAVALEPVEPKADAGPPLATRGPEPQPVSQRQGTLLSRWLGGLFHRRSS
jgi:HAE1 family hydrophobic/amphiphilic exporter-1